MLPTYNYLYVLTGRDVADVLEELLTHRAQAVVSALKSSASVREQLTNVRTYLDYRNFLIIGRPIIVGADFQPPKMFFLRTYII